MLKLQSSPYTAPSWLKWGTLILGIIILLTLSLAIWIYVDANSDRTAGHEDAAALAEQETELTRVEHISTYYGDREVHIVQGVNEADENGLVFIDLAEKTVLEEIFPTNALPIEEVKKQWENTCDSCTFRDIQYGYEENEPVYELTYIDGQNRYVMDYFTLRGDSFDQRFAFKKKE